MGPVNRISFGDEQDFSECEAACIPLIKFFNSYGLPTEFSCQGHDSPQKSMFYIMFDSSVITADIILFQSRYLNRVGHFVSCGRFSKRLTLLTYLPEGNKHSAGAKGECKAYSVWEYTAATVEAADADLATWQAIEASRAGQTCLGFVDADRLASDWLQESIAVCCKNFSTSVEVYNAYSG